MTRLRTLLFLTCFYGWTFILAVFYLPGRFLPGSFLHSSGRIWARSGFFLLRVICGVKHEVRGAEYILKTPAIYASKHQSAWDTLVFWLLMEKPVFVLKQELIRIPLYGPILLKIGSIAIDRQGKSEALKAMIAKAKQRLAAGHSIIIFPEGTRTLPDAAPQYQPGVAALYGQLSAPVVPVALNSGKYWGKGSTRIPSGTIIIEFLPPIAPGMRARDFLAQLQEQVEAASGKLV